MLIPLPTPVIARPTMNCAVAPALPVRPGTAVIWMMTPMILAWRVSRVNDHEGIVKGAHMIVAPRYIARRRPSQSPKLRMKQAPRKHPTA